jgi:streptogramin lyase
MRSRAAPGAEGPSAEGDPSSGGSPAIESIAVAAGPVGLAIGADHAVWVVSSRADRVSRIPAGASMPDLVVEVPGTPLRATAAYDALWVTSFRGEELVRLDPLSGEISGRVPTGAGPEGVTAAFGAVWVVTQDAGRLLRIDPKSMTVTEQVEIGVGARLVASGPRWLYVSHYARGQVLRVDPATGDLHGSREICDGPQGLAIEHGRLWVACTTGNGVVVLGSETLEMVDRLHGPEAPDPVTLAPDGTVLAVSQAGPTVVSIDPATREPLGRLELGGADQLYDQANIDAVVAGDRVWVSSFNHDVVLRARLP